MNNKNKLLFLFLLLFLILVGYVYVGGMMGNKNEVIVTPLEMEDSKQTEEVSASQFDDAKSKDNGNQSVEVMEEKSQGVSADIANTNEVTDEEATEEIVKKEESKPVSADIKFGKTKGQRSLIWKEYQKRQGEILLESEEINSDRYSKQYLGHVDREISKLSYDLQKRHNVKKLELEYIINEGKKGKFTDMTESF